LVSCIVTVNIVCGLWLFSQWSAVSTCHWELQCRKWVTCTVCTAVYSLHSSVQTAQQCTVCTTVLYYCTLCCIVTRFLQSV
jgi:hypothetical protein